MYYDSPKVVEAIIRLARGRRFGREPIFRFDADVEVDDQNVRRLLEYYARQSRRRYYFFSGGYRSRHPQDERCELLNKYAVRLAQFCDQGGGVATLDKDKARRFLRDLRDIGADPETQVISGAGLCISPEAIRMLPPFANVGEQIIWIDDHLKRILHEELGHFRYPRDVGRRCDEARFIQDRYPPPDGVTAQAVGWHGGEYLERLVRGCLMDALIRDRNRRRRGVLAECVDAFIRTGGLTLPKPQVETMLRRPANERLDLIINTWKGKGYIGSPVFNFAESLSGAESAQDGRVLYTRGLIEDVDAYCHLLGIWSQFVYLCQSVDRRTKVNRWLFREPV
jgi:hypothetical protein